MDYYPLFADLAQRPVLVVGGGAVALRKIDRLLAAGACVRLTARELHPTLVAYVQQQQLEFVAEQFHPQQLDGVFLVIAATSDRLLNQQIYQAAELRCLLANVIDDSRNSSFIVPTVVDRSPVLVAISSGGSSPILARLLREQLDAFLPQTLGKIAHWLQRWRGEIKQQIRDIQQRQRLWQRLMDSRLFSLLEADQTEAAEQLLQATLQKQQATGEVCFMAVRSRDPELLTVKAWRALQRAEGIIYDSEIAETLLAQSRKSAQRKLRAADLIAAGAELVELAQQGIFVVRLTYDAHHRTPACWAAEIEALRQANLPYQIMG